MQSVAHSFLIAGKPLHASLSTSCFSPNDDVLVGNTSGGNGKVQTEGEYFLFIIRQDSTTKIPHYCIGIQLWCWTSI